MVKLLIQYLQVVGRHNIWSLVARSHEHSPQTILDWAEMEGLFCQQTLSTPTPTSQSSPRASRSESADKRKDVTSEVSITVIAKVFDLWSIFYLSIGARLPIFIHK